MHFRGSNSREAYSEAMGELSAHGEKPERLPRLEPSDGGVGRRHPEGSYGELNWEWEGAQRGPFSGKGPKGYRRSDDRIREDAGEALYRAGDLDASDMTVEVHEGEIVLDGMVADRRSKRRAEELVEGLPGVRDVHNRLRISRGTGQ